MNRMPGFSAEMSLSNTARSGEPSRTVRYRGRAFVQYSVPLVQAAAFPGGGGFTTLPTCGWENCRTAIVYEQCGSAPDGVPPPMCAVGTKTECDYVCTFPNGSKATM